LVGWMTQFGSIVVMASVVFFSNYEDNTLQILSAAITVAAFLVWWGFMIGGGLNFMI